MTKERYTPRPMNTGGVELSDELLRLGELLAKNTHEVWAHQRLADGWKYGPERNDTLKHHPGIVPYEQLSESEKDYDRNTSTETLKVIQALGFEIKKQTI